MVNLRRCRRSKIQRKRTRESLSQGGIVKKRNSIKEIGRRQPARILRRIPKR